MQIGLERIDSCSFNSKRSRDQNARRGFSEGICSENFQLLKNESLAIRELRIQETCQVLWAFLAFHTYEIKNDRILNLLFHTFCRMRYSVILLNAAHFLQLVAKNIRYTSGCVTWAYRPGSKHTFISMRCLCWVEMIERKRQYSLKNGE